MAEFNLSKEPELVEGREKIQELTETGEKLTKTIEDKLKELSEFEINHTLSYEHFMEDNILLGGY